MSTAFGQGAISVAVNNVDIQPNEAGTAYQVTSYVTVTDAAGLPVETLTNESFEIRQDSSPVELQSAELTTRPIYVMLVIDTSGSMASQDKMEAVKAAASDFVGSLKDGDQAGLIYFSDSVTLAQGLSGDLVATTSIISLLEPKEGGGTCLYDAAYQAVSALTSAPVGERAVILLTDGIDERPDQTGPCSTHTPDQVIAYANDSATRSMVYTLGVGTRVDKPLLNQIAESTGGSFLAADDPSAVGQLLQVISARLQRQYALKYQTETTSGEHTLTVNVSHEGSHAVGTRSFFAPALPPALRLTGIDDGAILGGTQAVRASMSGAGQIEKVTFSLDGTTVAEDSDAPYEISLDSAQIAVGTHRFEARAALNDGTEISASLNFAVAAPAPAVVAPPESASVEFPMGVVVGLGLVVLVAVGAGVWFGRRGRAVAAPASLPPDAFGVLTVKESVSLKKGHILPLVGEHIRIGRGEDNEVVIPDAPISRHHAQIHHIDGGLRIVDLGSTYGTFVNKSRVEKDGLVFKDGDSLRIGSRTIVIYTGVVKPETGFADRTFDPNAGTIMGITPEGTVPMPVPPSADRETKQGQGDDDDIDPHTLPTAPR